MKTLKRSILWLLIITSVFMSISLTAFASSGDTNSNVTEQISGTDVGPMGYEQCTYWLDGRHHMNKGGSYKLMVDTGYDTIELVYQYGYLVGYWVCDIYKEIEGTNYYCACGYNYDVEHDTGYTEPRRKYYIDLSGQG